MSHLFPDNDRAWHLREIKAPEAWAFSKGAGILIGHIDTGYTLHDELEQALDLTASFDTLKGQADARDPMAKAPTFRIGGDTIGKTYKTEWPGHGTFTGSVLASRGIVIDAPAPGDPAGGTDALRDAAGDILVKGVSITGVAPEATLVPFRVERAVVTLETAPLGRAINRAVRAGCHVISISLGGLDTQFLFDTVVNAVMNNVIVVAAGGQIWPLVPFPAQYWECIAAGASTAEHKPWPPSTHGPAITVSAPGDDVWFAAPSRTIWNGGDATDLHKDSGTSFATPCVAGAAALWLGTHGRDNLLDKYRGKNLLQTVFRHLLETTARDPGPGKWDPSMGAGILDAHALVTAELPDDLLPDATPATDTLAAWLRGMFPPPQQPAARAALGAMFAPSPTHTLEKIVEEFGTELRHLFMLQPPAFDLFRMAVEHFERGEDHDALELVRGTLRLLLGFASRRLAELFGSP